MKLKHLIFTGIAAMTFAAAPITASAHSAVFADTAGTVGTGSWETIDDVLWDVHVEHDCDVMIKTTNDLEGMTIRNYADAYYEEWHGDKEEDGILLVVSMDTREYFILTSGSCIYSFTDAGLDYIEAQIVPDMSAGDYETAFLEFAELCDDFLVQAASGQPYDGNRMPKEPFNVGMSLLIALGVGLAAGGIGLLFLFGNLKSVRQQHGAADYTKPNSFRLENQRDLFLYRKVRREEKEDDDDNKRGSSTFTGGSGDTRGGSGGTF